jgi:hypothetical protein
VRATEVTPVVLKKPPSPSQTRPAIGGQPPPNRKLLPEVPRTTGRQPLSQRAQGVFDASQPNQEALGVKDRIARFEQHSKQL